MAKNMTVAYDAPSEIGEPTVSPQEHGEPCKRKPEKSKTGHGVGAKPASKAELHSSRWPVAEMSSIYCLPVQL